VVGDRKRYEDALKTGTANLDSEQWKEAFRSYRVAVSEFPKEPEPYAGLGEACFGMNRIDKALELYKVAARYSRGDIFYLQKVADLQERLGQLDAAGRTYMAMGEIHLRRRQLDDAVNQWQRAIRLEPNLLGTHKRLAMVYQRQNKIRDAVREYLAIARILQMRGDKERAIRMCQAALRLDPENEDVLKAFELIRGGPEAFADVEEEEAEAVPAEVSDDVGSMIRQMASAFEAERPLPVQKRPDKADPVETARRKAQDMLAEEIFREEEDDEPVGKLSKLERDALIGQGMDYEMRGQVADAITCYEKAIDGGLQLPAVRFTLGLLYLSDGEADKARRELALAAKDPIFNQASRAALSSS
jgi:tetratricopeptide (TPR) repeat protein